VSGILGEDFLGHFDLLIDNRHHVVQLQLGPGPMSDMFKGERLPVQLEVTLEDGRCEPPVSLWRGAKPRRRRDTPGMFRSNDLQSHESIHLYTKGASATAIREQEGRKPDSARSAADDHGLHRRIDADIRIRLDLHQPLATIRHSRSDVEVLQALKAVLIAQTFWSYQQHFRQSQSHTMSAFGLSSTVENKQIAEKLPGIFSIRCVVRASGRWRLHGVPAATRPAGQQRRGEALRDKA
jgi:hypothetical protein